MAERIFGGKGSYDKYSLVKEFKQQYLLELEVIFLPSPPLPIIPKPPIIRYSKV